MKRLFDSDIADSASLQDLYLQNDITCDLITLELFGILNAAVTKLAWAPIEAEGWDTRQWLNLVWPFCVTFSFAHRRVSGADREAAAISK
jgi:hypothetical protein